MDKQKLSMEELEQVAGGNVFTDAWDWICDKFSSDGPSSSSFDRTHTNCGGRIKCEDAGSYNEDIWLTCTKCGKTWHPHSMTRIDQCEGL